MTKRNIDPMYELHRMRQVADALTHPLLVAPASCLYCDRQTTVRVDLFEAARHGSPEALCNWLDSRAAADCPCLLDLLFNVGHRATRRKLVREALQEDHSPERLEALHRVWRELQPKG